MAGKPFEVVFASSDQSQAQFLEYYAQMPWAALPFGAPEKAELSRRFGVSSMCVLREGGARGGGFMCAREKGRRVVPCLLPPNCSCLLRSPTLVILSPDGRVLSRNARGAVLRNPEGFPWEGDEDPRYCLGLCSVQ